MNLTRHILSSSTRTSLLPAFRTSHAGLLRTVRGNEAMLRAFSTRPSSRLMQEQDKDKDKQEEEEQQQNNKEQEGSHEDVEPEHDLSPEEAKKVKLQKDKDAKIEDLEARVKELEKKYLSSLAETENTRRIARTDVEKAKKYSLTNYTKSLLDVADNLDRAMTVIDADKMEEEFPEEKPRKKVTTLLQGIKMTQSILQRVFRNHGIERISSPLGDKFDPKFHEAINQHADPNMSTGTVSYVISEGYMINDRVLRATSVSVVVNEDEDLPSFDEQGLPTEKSEEENGEQKKEE